VRRVLLSALVLAATAQPLAEARAPQAVPLRRLVGQTIMTGFSGTTVPPALLKRVRLGEVGGIILFGGNVRSTAAVAALARQLQAAAKAGGNPPLLIATDQEGGPVRRLSGPPALSAPAMAARGAAYVRQQGAATGTFLHGAGINLDLAPVSDVPNSPTNFLVGRAFARQPGQVATLVSSFLQGLQTAHVAATAKHFPGLGTAPANTDLHVTRITTGQAELERRLLPFRRAVDDGVRLVMVSNAIYPALDASGTPAFASAPIVTGLLRGQLGFDGVVITDSMQTPVQTQTAHPAVRAVRAGVDVLLYLTPAASQAAFTDLTQTALHTPALRTQLEQSYARIQALKTFLGS
jgi:beta-N-acetylhexosaminidase